jgi:hypothetical protein
VNGILSDVTVTRQLEDALAVYFTEMDRCTSAKCYWALLQLAVIIPDVCGALELGAGTPIGTRYTDWCAANFNSGALTPADRYNIRNALLPEGSTLPNDT